MSLPALTFRAAAAFLLWHALAPGSHVFAQAPAPGTSIFGTRKFTEYIPGSLPLVIAAPHGGRLKPEDIPDRTQGVTAMDMNTQELARTLAEVIQAETGHRPHLVLCLLHRSKLDANRDLPEAAEGHEVAAQAWHEYHGFIEQACATAVQRSGFAFFIDLHGHSHPDARVELGYLHGAESLALNDALLDQPEYVQASSLRWIVEQRGIRHSQLLRGPHSLGALLEQEGFPATPSPAKPVPNVPFFRGGYTVAHHCRAEKNITGLQIEANRPQLRDTAENRLRFATALHRSLEQFFQVNLGRKLSPGTPAAPSSAPQSAGNAAPSQRSEAAPAGE
jgi:N-formylglutamate amidohydrolase